ASHGNRQPRRGQSTTEPTDRQGGVGRGSRDHPAWACRRARSACGTAEEADRFRSSGKVSENGSSPSKVFRRVVEGDARRGTVVIYFDTSILVPLVAPEPSNDDVRRLILRQRRGALATS